LAASDPANVLPGLAGVVYTEELGRLEGQGQAGEGGAAAASAEAGGSGEEDVVVGAFGEAGKGSGAGQPGGSPRRRPGEALGGRELEDLCGRPVPATAARGGARGSAEGERMASGEGHDIVAGGVGPAPVARPVPGEVEGRCLVVEEHWGEQGYRRYIVRCPLASAAHAEGTCRCVKRRGAGPAQTRRFGALEPVAFLGVWLRSASAHATRAQHMAFVPSEASVGQYMEEHGWA
ncbi:MAG: hypothetical protein GY772_12840, partial [bacterium]|nr:hypothetical protein [bacterium]